LSRLRSGDWREVLGRAAADERPRRAPATLVLTGIHWRSAWKYEERGYRHLYWDGGMKLAHILAAAKAADHPAVVLAGFVDQQVNDLLGIDGRREGALALVPLGNWRRGLSAPAVARDLPTIRFQPTPLSRRPIDYPEVLRYHTASMLKDERAIRDFRSGRPSRRQTPLSPRREFIQLPPLVPGSCDPSLDAVVRRRRSTRRFARKPISAAQLSTVLKIPSRGLPVDFHTTGTALLETYVLAHAVRGLSPGAYYFAPDTGRLVLLQERDLRAAAGFVCLNQDLARDASAVIYYLADLQSISAAYGERGYRNAELEAGLVAGRAYLAAYAIGRGATGLTFFDKEVVRLFSPHARGLEAMLVVAVGVPAKQR
jgi:SagB-type dehydrogenase family enzyme